MDDLQVAIKILQAARVRLEKGWIQRTMANNADGLAVNACDADAVSFCLLGSLVASSVEYVNDSNSYSIIYYIMMESIKETIYPEEPNLVNLCLFNDSPECTKEKVLDVLDRAILLLQNQMTPSQGTVLAMADGKSLEDSDQTILADSHS